MNSIRAAFRWLWPLLVTAVALYVVAGLITYLWQGRDWPNGRVWYSLTLVSVLLIAGIVGLQRLLNLDTAESCIAVICTGAAGLFVIGLLYWAVFEPMFTNAAIHWNDYQQLAYGFAGLLLLIFCMAVTPHRTGR